MNVIFWGVVFRFWVGFLTSGGGWIGFGCFISPGEDGAVTTVEEARFDSKAKSEGVNLSKDGKTASGVGVAVANAALHQDKCYFEFTLKKLPNDESSFCIGVCHRKPEVVALPSLGDCESSWAFNSTQSTESFKEGDVLGCIFDQSSGRPQLALCKNNQPLPPGTEVKGF